MPINRLLDVQDAFRFKGVINASTNPNYPAADAGHVYKISVAGKIGGAAGQNVEIGDMLTCTLDGSAAGDQATVGANWSITQTNIDGAVTGPVSAVDSRIAAFDGATGKLLKDGGKTIAELALLADLASTAAGKGASLIGVEDALGAFTATTAEGVLMEIGRWHASVTAAQLASVTDAINTTDKALRKSVTDTTNNRRYWPLGASAASAWRPFDDQTSTSDITPA